LNQTPLLIEMPNRLGGDMSKSLPCVREGCSICCRETTMPLTAAEASRLERRTGMKEDQFCSKDEEGIRRLLNNESTLACVFLATNSKEKYAPGVCSVYDSRPKGCRTFPIVLNDENNAILDDICPHTSEFDEPTEEDALSLLNLEAKLLQ
jgi:Fe-S-cluster containining protein